jgi:hypothetical protein
VQATIVSRAFFGHDQLLTLRLDSGQTRKARLGACGGFRPGDRVSVSVRGGALAFAHASSARVGPRASTRRFPDDRHVSPRFAS